MDLCEVVRGDRDGVHVGDLCVIWSDILVGEYSDSAVCGTAVASGNFIDVGIIYVGIEWNYGLLDGGSNAWDIDELLAGGAIWGGNECSELCDECDASSSK